MSFDDLQTQLIAGLQERGVAPEAISFAVSILAADHSLIRRSRSKHAEAQAKYLANKKKRERKEKEEAAKQALVADHNDHNDHNMITDDHYDHNPCIISYVKPMYVEPMYVKPMEELSVKQDMLNIVPVNRARARAKKSAQIDVFFDDWPNDYGEKFWNAYPKKNQKTKTIQLLGKIRAKGEVSWTDLMDGLSRYSDNLPEWQSWCWPIKWLTEERWTSNPAEQDQNGKRRSGSGLIQAADGLIAHLNGFGRKPEPTPEICSGKSAPNVRLLQKG